MELPNLNCSNCSTVAHQAAPRDEMDSVWKLKVESWKLKVESWELRVIGAVKRPPNNKLVAKTILLAEKNVYLKKKLYLCFLAYRI